MDETGCSAILVWIIGIGLVIGIYYLHSAVGVIFTIVIIVGTLVSTYIILVLLSYKEHKQNYPQHTFQDFWKFEGE